MIQFAHIVIQRHQLLFAKDHVIDVENHHLVYCIGVIHGMIEIDTGFVSNIDLFQLVLI